MTSITEQAEEYAEPLAEDLHRVVRRAFMAGALAALTSKAPREPQAWPCALTFELTCRRRRSS
jgi:hypothetical protein